MTASARAADPPEKWFPADFKKPSYTDLVSGWYVRGDMGWRKHRIESIDAPPAAVTEYRFPNTLTLGLGAGYKYKWFRADATLDYGLRKRLLADTALGPNYYGATIDSFTLLANVYLDLGSWGGFTPYVGVGGGASQLRTDELSMVGMGPIATQSKWSPSWAAMAGVSYQFTPTIALDVGYRYLSLGDAVSGPETVSSAGIITFKNITAQEIRVGIRWQLD